MEILEKIGDAASKTYKYTTEKTTKIAKETKLKMKINDYKKEIESIYIEIGEAVYEKFVVDEEMSKKDLKEKCEEIDRLSDKIVECKNEILGLKEKRQCKNCYEEIEISSNYCPNCGFEQEEIKKKTENDEQTSEEVIEAEKIDENEE